MRLLFAVPTLLVITGFPLLADSILFSDLDAGHFSYKYFQGDLVSGSANTRGPSRRIFLIPTLTRND
jgi:hypothetical protein